MKTSTPRVVTPLAITFVGLWVMTSGMWFCYETSVGVASSFEAPQWPRIIFLAPVAPVYLGVSFLKGGNLDMALASLGVSALAISLSAFSIAKRRALALAIMAIILYWFWSNALLGIGV